MLAAVVEAEDRRQLGDGRAPLLGVSWSGAADEPLALDASSPGRPSRVRS